jgi:mannose-1-phosphate guanylyltransferase
MYAAIIAGGSGTRLWPASRISKPKQFHSLSSEKSMLLETIERIEDLVPKENILIIANKSHEKIVKEEISWMTKENWVGEPIGKNTAPAVGIAAAIVANKDPEGVILVTPADHVILKQQKFIELLKVAEKVALEGSNVVTIGIRPTAPETGYGYIEMSEEHRDFDGVDVHKVNSFKEKPNHKTAEEYVSSWHYVWNSGMFIWSAKTILELFRDHAPDIYKLLLQYMGAIGTSEEEKVFEEVYDAFPSISVDYAIMEHAKNIFVIPAAIGWNDVGSWASLFDIMPQDEDGNVIVGDHVHVDSHNCLIHTKDRLIATIGLDNFIVVDTGDAILIMPKGRSQDVKLLLDELKNKGLQKYL